MLDNKTITKLKLSIQKPPNMETYPSEHLNCYAYALGITYFDRKDFRIRYYPGLLSSEKFYSNKNHPKTYEQYFRCIQNDCEMLGLECSEVYLSGNEYLKKNQYLIGIYHHDAITRKDLTAAHFIRYDRSIGWSHKLGWYKSPEQITELKKQISFGENLYSFLGLIIVNY